MTSFISITAVDDFRRLCYMEYQSKILMHRCSLRLSAAYKERIGLVETRLSGSWLSDLASSSSSKTNYYQSHKRRKTARKTLPRKGFQLHLLMAVALTARSCDRSSLEPLTTYTLVAHRQPSEGLEAIRSLALLTQRRATDVSNKLWAPDRAAAVFFPPFDAIGLILLSVVAQL
jgi:hypothetical protein